MSLADLPWWAWPLALAAVGFALGVVAVPAGIGGGTLFVPIVASLFPIHVDYIRAMGLLVALSSALSAAPVLLRNGLASLRLALPLAVAASAAALVGAWLGLALPARAVQIMLGLMVLGIVALMIVVKPVETEAVLKPEHWALLLGLHGSYRDAATWRAVRWSTQRTWQGIAMFGGIGLLGGLFGIGAGWANVPVLNLLMAVPLKLAAGTSALVLSLSSASAIWVYVGHGAVVPLLAVPAVAGTMLGARIGARLLDRIDGRWLRRLVIGLLCVAALRSLGQGLWGSG